MQKIKAIAAGLGGLLMAGATLMTPVLAEKTIGQAFSDMNPENTIVVVGQNAAVSDVVGAIAVAAELGQHGATAVSAGTTSESVSGGVSLSSTSTQLYLFDSITKLKRTLTSDDMPSVLSDETFTDDNGKNYDYEQRISLGNKVIDYSDASGDLDNPEILIDVGTDEGNPLLTYTVEFIDPIDMDEDNVKGNSITLFGKEWTIGSDTELGTTPQIELFGSSESVLVSEGEEKTVGDADVKVDFIGQDNTGTYVVLVINGQSKKAYEGSSYTIGGVDVYVKNVYYSEKESQVSKAELNFGSKRLLLKDGSQVKVGEDEDSVDGTEVTISMDGDNVASISVAIAAEDDDHDFIKVGETFQDNVFGAVKVKFDSVDPSLDSDKRENVVVDAAGDDTLKVSMSDDSGNVKDVEWAYLEGGSIHVSDGDGHPIVTSEVDNGIMGLEEKDYFFVNTKDQSHLFQIRDISLNDDGESDDDEIVIRDVVSGKEYTIRLDGDDNDGSDTLTKDKNIDGYTYTFEVPDDHVATPVVNIYYDPDPETGVDEIALWSTVVGKTGHRITFYSGPLTIKSGAGTSYDPTEFELFGIDDLKVDANALSGDGADGTNAADQYLPTKSDESWRVVVYDEDGSNSNGAVDYAVKLQYKDDGGLWHDVPENSLILVEEESNANTYSLVIIPSKIDGDELDIDTSNLILTGEDSGFIKTEDSDVSRAMDKYGVLVEKDTNPDQGKVTISYPDEQMIARVAVGPDPQFGISSAGAKINFVPVSSSVSKLDTEVSSTDKASKNLILVGGPAINSLVAELADEGKTLSLEQWRSDYVNKAIVQVVEDAFASGEVALVVAGYEADDTRNAVAKLISGAVNDKSAVVLSGDTVSDLNLEQSSQEEEQSSEEETNSTTE